MSFDDLIKNLQRDYIRELPERLQRIENFCRAADVPHLYDEFHKLKGTGQTFGVPEISLVSAVLEQLCRAAAPQALTLSQTALAILRDIQRARSEDQPFDVAQDGRFIEIQKHLPVNGETN